MRASAVLPPESSPLIPDGLGMQDGIQSASYDSRLSTACRSSTYSHTGLEGRKMKDKRKFLDTVSPRTSTS